MDNLDCTEEIGYPNDIVEMMENVVHLANQEDLDRMEWPWVLQHVLMILSLIVYKVNVLMFFLFFLSKED